jgi:cell division protein FtsB
MSLGTFDSSRSGASSERRGASRAAYGLALALCAGLASYCALSMLVGPAGLAAYHRLEGRKAAMEANLGELKAIGERLSAELESLKSDPDRAAREARSLGYLRKGEKALLLGERQDRARPIDVGSVLPDAVPAVLGDAALKEMSLGAGLAVLALLLAPRRLPPGRKRSYR